MHNVTKKACDEEYANWQAFQQVYLAYKIVLLGDTKRFKGDKGQLAQLVRVIAGEQDDVMNDEGNRSEAPWVKRLRAALERFKAGDFPAYNLYEVPTSGATSLSEA